MENIVLEEFSDGFFLNVFAVLVFGFFWGGEGGFGGLFWGCVCFLLKLKCVFLLINSTVTESVRQSCKSSP